ncbi:MAG: hypothetical protein Q9214_003544, partial [Letrouitia sp. 1 TL-2023]
GGGIRGFMNDGTTDYRSHHAVDSLAFGHCDYAYRNLGRPSRIEIKQAASSFEVAVDGRSCIRSDKIKLPSGYFFGISAASADTPDSFEAYKFILSTTSSTFRQEPRRDMPLEESSPQHHNDQASKQSGSDAQYTELHRKLQIMGQSVDNVLREVLQLATKSEGRHQEISRSFTTKDELHTIDQRIKSIENTLHEYHTQFANLQGLLKDSHSSLNEGLTQQMTHRM